MTRSGIAARTANAMRQDEMIPAKMAGALAIGLVAFACIGVPQPSRAGEADAGATHGKALFEKRCTGCHALDRDREGPRLRDVYGRKAGSVAGFPYSDGLKGAHITWDDALLEKWLTDTESVIPGNNMDFRVPSAEERADIIAFLRATSQAAQK